MTTIKCTVQRSSWYSVYIEYSSKQDTINNQSTITHALKLKQLTDDYDFNGYMDIAYYVEGEKFSYSGNIDINNKGNAGYTITIKSGTTIVDHHANGEKMSRSPSLALVIPAAMAPEQSALQRLTYLCRLLQERPPLTQPMP